MENTGRVQGWRVGTTLAHVGHVRTLPFLGWLSFSYQRSIMKTLSKLNKQIMHRSLTSVCP